MRKTNKIFAITIAMFLILSMTAMTGLIPKAKAQSYTITSSVSMSVDPNPVGVGQPVDISIFVFPVPPVAMYYYQGLTVKITLPDKTTSSISSINTQTEGTATVGYTPTETGVYSFLVTYPGQTFPNGDTVSPGQYNTTLTVQTQPLTYSTGAPLPTSYWSNPINGQNRAWASISGDWLMRSYNASNPVWDSAAGFNPYSLAPLTSHIMWTKPLAAGGIVGGTSGDTTYYSGLSYEEYLTPPIIMDGYLYYNTHYGGIIPSPFTGFNCVNLRTGQLVYQDTQYTISYGMEYDLETGNQAGVVGPYLWALSAGPSGTTTWNLIDAFTGEYVCSFTNGTTGTAITGPNGELDVYVLNTAAGTFSFWNSTQAFMAAGIVADDLYPSVGVFDWSPQPGNFSWTAGIQWTQTVPVILAPSYFGVGPLIVFGVTGNVLLADDLIGNGTFSIQAGYSLTTGKQLWVNTQNQYLYPTFSGGGIYAHFDPAARSWIAYDVNTGKQLWISTPYANPWAAYTGTAEGATFAYGMIYAGTYGGMYAINAANGKIVWNVTASSGLNTPYGSYPFFYGAEVADGVVYVATGEHSPTQPLEQGEGVYAINATTGQILWEIPGYMPIQAIADGFLLGYSAYDNQIYVFGQGPSKTTVSAPQVGITTSTPVTITGLVTDVSAGASQNAVAADFPNGLPCVSDASMSGLMEAAYEQQPLPSNLTGVPVTLFVLDSNNNYRSIGTTTTDASGFYSFNWKPDIVGNYTVTAVFAGTQSYYGSSAQTALYASSPAATAAPAATPITGLASNTTVMYGIVAIIIVIVIIGAVLALLVTRKHP